VSVARSGWSEFALGPFGVSVYEFNVRCRYASSNAQSSPVYVRCGSGSWNCSLSVR
jgi:hypothetical protein